MSSKSEDQPNAVALERAPGNPTLFGVPPDQARVQLEDSVAQASRKFGFTTEEGEAAPEGAEVDSGADATLLVRLLADQRAATLQARAEALELQKSLAEVQERLTKTKGQIGVIPVRLEDANGRLRPDAVLIKAQWERARKDLQRSQVARTRDSEQAVAKLAEVTEALRLAKEAAARERLDSKRESRSRMLSGMGVVAVVLCLVLFAVTHWDPPKWVGDRAHPIKRSEPAPERSEAARSVTEESPVLTDQGISQPLSNGLADNSDVTREIGRLTRALSRFPGVDPEVVMRAVNKRVPAKGATPCAFEWNHGEPALQFGDRQGGNGTISASLSRCATAVEQFR
jgi:hypothetical protein